MFTSNSYPARLALAQTHPGALVTLLVRGPLTDYRTMTESCPYSEGWREVRCDVCTADTPSHIAGCHRHISHKQGLSATPLWTSEFLFPVAID